jgi:hypothetical protein
MAFTNTPKVSTYTTKRVNFVNNPQQRSSDATKDARMVNMLAEDISGVTNSNPKWFTKSRPGLSSTYSTTTGEGRGVYTWTVSGVSYAMTVVGSSVYSNNTFLQTITTSTGVCGFTEFINASGVVSLVMVDGTKGYVFASPTAAVTLIADVDFPSPHIPNPVFMDGYLFVAKANSQDIYNSNLNDPSLWTAGDFISAEMYPDTIQALSKNNNFIYAIGSGTVEYFYDAANATASPLAREASAVQQFGTPAPKTVVQTEKEVVLVGATANGGYTVWTIDGFKEKEISIPYIRSVLEAEGSALANATAFCVRAASQKLYLVCLTNKTLVYSFDTKLWTEWDSGSGNFICGLGCNGPTGTPYLLHKTAGTVYKLTETVFTDGGTAFTCSIVTPKLDFETINRKTCSRFVLVGDVPDDTLVDSTVYLSWSDDDYKTWSTPRAITFDADLPQLKQLGMFRRRAFKITYNLPHLLRLEGVEIDINKGGA